MTLLSFVLSKASGAKTKTALGIAAATGTATYLAVEHTDTGAQLSKDFDSFLGVDEKPKADVAQTGTSAGTAGVNADGTPKTSNSNVSSNASSGSSGLGSALKGLWDGLGGVGQAAVGVGAGVAAGSFLSKYGLWIAGGIGTYFLLKD